MNRTPIPAPMRPRPASQGENAIRIAQTFNAALTEDHRGHFEQAKSLYELVLRMDPSSLGALHNLAYLLFRQGERGQAERILRKTIKAHPRSAEAHNTLGLVLHTTARFREAVVCYRKGHQFEGRLRYCPQQSGRISARTEASRGSHSPLSKGVGD